MEMGQEADHNQFDTLTPDLPPQYELLSKVSEGGMGAIYKVRNRYTNLYYAIKVLRPENANDKEMKERFIFEAKAASMLKHPNICQVHDFGITQNQMPYLVMDWIEGISLGKKVSRFGPLSASEAIPIFQHVAAALAHAHQHRVIHRDLKPDNIMLARGDKEGPVGVYLVDFGIAKVLDSGGDITQSLGLTKTGMVVGTPLYMSPEQARGKDVDNRSDIYSLGCVMYFALAGKPPFVGDSFADTIYQHINSTPPELDPKAKIPGDLKTVMLKAMEKRPEDRYANTEEISTDLKKLTKGVSLDLGPLAAEREKSRKMIMTILTFVVSFVVVYAASVFLNSALNSISQNPKPAQHSNSTK